MPELAQPAGRFRVIARGKLADAHIQQALDDSTDRLRSHRLSAFLASVGFRPLPRNAGRRIAYHDSCHMLRELHVSAQPRRLLGGSGAELVPFARPDLCCGFGGTFSVRQPEVSLAMADDKLADGEASGTIVTADPGCLMHLRGRAEKTGSPVRVVHLATALARGVGG